MAKITVRKNFRFSDIRTRPTERKMREAGSELAEKIRRRTKAGSDEDGKAFVPGTDGGPVDLSRTGGMLDDLGVVAAAPGYVKVGFSEPKHETVAAAHQFGTKHLPRRPFLGLSRSMIDDLLRRLFRRVR